MQCDITIRTAHPDDAEELLAIYKHYVETTAITFTYDAPAVSEFREKIERTLKKYPYLAAVVGDEIVGYCCTGTFVGRAAYDWGVETTIYVKNGMQKSGIGKRLYAVLENISQAQNILNLNACIALPSVEDEHLTRNSADFHSHMGYHLAGKFTSCGYKFGRWYDMIWMEKLIGEHTPTPDPVIPFPELSDEVLRGCGVTL